MGQMVRWCIGLAFAAAFASTNTFAQQADFIMGVCNHLAHGRSTAQQSLDAMAKLGVNSFRDDVFWSLLETEKDVLRWPTRLQELERAIDSARSRGIEPLIILAYENRFHHEGRYPVSNEAQAAFTRFAEFVVNRFKGRVKYYEVWNEWNQGGSAKDYVRLLKRVYPAIKRIDSSAVVLGGAVEGAGPPNFIRAMMEQGALTFMDGLSVHPYVFWRGPSGTPQALYQWVVDLQTMLRQYSNNRDVLLYLTEIGWPTDSGGRGVSEEKAADYAAQTALMMRSLPYVKGIWWYNLFNKGKDPKDHEVNFGLMTEDGQPKPAFNSFAQVSELISKSRFIRREASAPDTWALRFANPTGDETLALFHTGQKQVQIRAGTTTNNLNLIARHVGSSATKSNASGNRALPLPLSGTPILLTGSAQSLTEIKFSDRAQP
jgi:polysaccharide biosynthesis protein PslG